MIGKETTTKTIRLSRFKPNNAQHAELPFSARNAAQILNGRHKTFVPQNVQPQGLPMQTQNNWMADLGLEKVNIRRTNGRVSKGYKRILQEDQEQIKKPRISDAHMTRMIDCITACLKSGNMTQKQMYIQLKKNNCIPDIEGKPAELVSVRPFMSKVKKELGLYCPASLDILKLYDAGNSIPTIMQLLNVSKRHAFNCLVYHERIKPYHSRQCRMDDSTQINVVIPKANRMILEKIRKQKRYSLSRLVSELIDQYIDQSKNC